MNRRFLANGHVRPVAEERLPRLGAVEEEPEGPQRCSIDFEREDWVFSDQLAVLDRTYNETLDTIYGVFYSTIPGLGTDPALVDFVRTELDKRLRSFATQGDKTKVLEPAEGFDANPNPTDEEARYWLAGNLCRCTGYDKIMKAVHDAAAQMRGETV